MSTNPLGKIIGVLLILVLVGVGVWVVTRKPDGKGGGNASAPGTALPAGGAARQANPPPASDPELVETESMPKRLESPGTYHPKDNIVEIELSEYAGYAGLIVANGGMAPNEDSIFFKKYGFKVKLAVSEEESWGSLNSGKLAASATTTDVLAAYGKQFQVTVPAQFGFSRGADAIVVHKDIARINELKGKTLVACQFTEADFFLRYLATEAGLPVNMLQNLKDKPDPEAVNLVFSKDGFTAGDLLLKDVQGGYNRLAGAVTWSPKTEEVVAGSGGKLKVLVSNRNLLIVADVLVVNKGFADAYPRMVEGLVEGVLTGNKMVRDNPVANYDMIEKAFKWEKGKAKAELQKVHLSNLPESMAFFSGEIDTAGSFAGIFQSAVIAYGPTIVPDPVNPSRFVNTVHLEKLKASGAFADQKIAIAPIKLLGREVEGNPLLSKNIRFLFAPNTSTLEMKDANNIKQLDAVKELLTVSPGSLLELRGHVDDAKKEEFRSLGAQRLQEGALRAVKLSQDRANEIKQRLVERGVAKERVDTLGRGWEEPLGTDRDQNRRVEVRWFTLE